MTILATKAFYRTHMNIQTLASFVEMADKMNSLQSFHCFSIHRLATDLPSDCLTEMTPNLNFLQRWTTAAITAQSGLQDNHIKVTPLSLGKNHSSGFPILICLLQYGVISLSSILKRAERKLQPYLHAYQVVILAVDIFQFCLAGREHLEETGTSFKAEVCIASFRALLFHTVATLGWCSLKKLLMWFLLCCFDSWTVADAGAWEENRPDQLDRRKKGVSP